MSGTSRKPKRTELAPAVPLSRLAPVKGCNPANLLSSLTASFQTSVDLSSWVELFQISTQDYKRDNLSLVKNAKVVITLGLADDINNAFILFDEGN